MIAPVAVTAIALSLTLAGCSTTSSDGRSPASASPTRSASAEPVVSAAPALVGCPLADVTALATALPGTRWTAATGLAPTGGRCKMVVRATTGTDNVEVTYAPTSLAERAVANFRRALPALPNSEPLKDLGVTVASAGVVAQNGGTLLLLLQAARPTYLVSVRGALTAAVLAGSRADTARQVMAWALAQQPH